MGYPPDLAVHRDGSHPLFREVPSARPLTALNPAPHGKADPDSPDVNPTSTSGAFSVHHRVAQKPANCTRVVSGSGREPSEPLAAGEV